MKKYIIYGFLVIGSIAYAQDKYRNADKSFESLWYVKAAQQYESIIEKGDDSQEVLQKIGDAYYFNTDMENANKWYGVLFSKYENVLDPEYAFRYIHTLEGVGNYRLAKGLMKVYSEKMQKEGFDVDQLMENDSKLDYILNQQPQFYVSHLPMNTRVADFGTMFYKDKIIFSSSRDTLNLRTRVYKWNEQPFLNLFIADTLQKGTDLVEITSLPKTINSKYHEAIVAFNKEGNVMYFTRNNYSNKELGKDEEGMNHLKMYKAFLENGEWTNVEELPFNSEDYSVGQPAMGPEGKKLYFVSDMPGSIGETDIFVVDILGDNTYSNPKNLGPKINTSGREMFPFVTDKKIYFASDGHLGLGGLDVFESVRTDTFSEPVNLGKPLNSNLDDFAYIVNEENQRGYFSSNREGGTGDDDIYSFQRFDVACKQSLIGTVVNEVNGIPVDNVVVRALDKQGEELSRTMSNVNGEYLFELALDCSTDYTVEVSKEGYDLSTKTFETPVTQDFVNQVPMGLKKRNKLIAEEDGLLKIKIGIIFFDLDKSNIRYDAAVELNKVVFLMKEYPKMVIKIESHTDSRADGAYNKDLSERRAISTRDFIISQGIEAERIESALGYGEERLINECANGVPCTDAQHDLNRRSEFIILNIN
ncbi:MAG: OmpA family protein [Bacteroidota bacterium]